MTLFAQKNIDGALSQIQAKADAQPGWATGYEVLGQLSFMAKRYPQAEAAFHKALSIDPKDANAEMTLGQTLAVENKTDEALNVFNKLGQEQPRMAPVQVLMGQMYERRGDSNQAVVHYKSALELDPDNILVKNNLAWIYAETGGNIDVALRLAQEAEEARPDDPAISDTLAWIYVKKQSYDNAVKLLQTSVTKEPNKALYRYHLGMAYYQSGRKPEAKEALQMALKLEPNFPHAAEAKQILGTINN